METKRFRKKCYHFINSQTRDLIKWFKNLGIEDEWRIERLEEIKKEFPQN